MGTILPRPRKDGTTAYYAQIAVRHNGKQHREQKTFDRKAAAQAWVKRREYELAQPGAFDPKPLDAPLSEVIEKYVSTTRKAIGRTKAQVLQSIQRSAFGAIHCSDLRSTDIVAYAQELSAGRQPQTVMNYLSHLGSVVAIAKPAWGYPLDAEQMTDALKVLKRLGLTSKSRMRSRRPTVEEMDRLMQHFSEVHARRPLTCPMHRVIAFALFSTRRQEEITRITWRDLDVEGSRVLVRDMKNPGQKVGNDVWCELPPEALAIVQAMPKRDVRIFPFTTDAISASFTRACVFLGIEDLHFHDLRHEGVSRLFEMGRTVPLAASVSGHRSWQSMQRYTHIQRRGDQWADWQWLATLTDRPSQ